MFGSFQNKAFRPIIGDIVSQKVGKKSQFNIYAWFAPTQKCTILTKRKTCMLEYKYFENQLYTFHSVLVFNSSSLKVVAGSITS